MDAPTVAFLTLGCRVNLAETQALLNAVGSSCGVVPFGQPADLTVLNTCTVTAEAHARSLQALRRARRASPEGRILVAGCAAALVPEAFTSDPLVTWVPHDGPHHLAQAAARLLAVQPATEPAAPGTWGHTRAFLKVSEGCSNRCSFCVIPRTRGPAVSLGADEVVAQARGFVAAGYQEVVLTGTNLVAWGRDTGEGDLGDLVGRLLDAVPEVRVRLSSLEPIGFPASLREAIAHPRVQPHVHLCLQSGSDAVLGRMRRRYAVAGYRRLVADLRSGRPDLALTTDVLVGFPGEGAADHAATLALLDEVGFAGLHAFPFSARPGTEAERLPGRLPPASIAERMAEVLARGQELHGRFQQAWVGREVEVLVERGAGPGDRDGLTPHGLRVHLAGDPPPGRRLWVRVLGVREGQAYGEAVGLADATPAPSSG